MNYWGVETANLAECHEPLMQFMREVSVTGARVARQMYHRPGWVLHHNTSIWRDAQPVDWYSYVSFWPMGGGWLCEHLWEHYLFNPDSTFLRRTIYPILKGAAQFYDSWLADDGNGRLLTPVSDSPENMFYYTDQNGEQKSGGITMGSTLDMAIIREVFINTMEAGRLLGADKKWRAHLQARFAQLLPYQVGSRGQLLEYYKEYKEVPPRHNTSPYYPLYPGAQITPAKTPGLASAEEVLLKERGRAGGGWPSAWLACCWARLHQGDTAMKYVDGLVMHRHSNFFNGGGTVFQIDGNLGVVAAVTEMLLQSHTGEIELLPALPAAWPSGSVKGLKARGGFEVSVEWKDGKMINSSIKNISGETSIVRYREKSTAVRVKKGETLYLNERLEPVTYNPGK
jgi:alpha-L-fucosidase 2